MKRRNEKANQYYREQQRAAAALEEEEKERQKKERRAALEKEKEKEKERRNGNHRGQQQRPAVQVPPNKIQKPKFKKDGMKERKERLDARFSRIRQHVPTMGGAQPHGP